MIETIPTAELIGSGIIIVIFAWAAVVLARWLWFAFKDACWWFFEILTRAHWRLHRKFFPGTYIVGMDVAVGDCHTAIMVARRNRDGTVKVLDMRVFPRAK